MAAADPAFNQLEPPLPPLPENFDNIIGAPLGQTANVNVIANNIQATIPAITLVRRDNPQWAYAELDSPGWPRNLAGQFTGRPANWGEARLAVAYRNVGPNTFACPGTRGQIVHVIIKRINVAAIQEYAAGGGHENPRKEVARMRLLGDDVHVLTCLDFLEDSKYIYIVTKKGQSLLDWFNSVGRDIPQFQAEHIFTKILRIIMYLRRHGICHHDISPGNFLFVEPDGELVAFDLALSIRWQVNRTSGIRHQIIEPQVFYGTPQFTSPEVFLRLPYDGVQLDLWGGVVIFYYLLTGFTTFNVPNFWDPLFRAFALGPNGGGFAEVQVVNDALVVLDENEQANGGLLNRINSILNANLMMSHDQRLLFVNSYEVDRNLRWTLDQVRAQFGL